MLRLNPPSNPTALVVSASAGSASRVSLLAGCAIIALGEAHMPMQRVELSRVSPAALYDGLASDKLDRAVRGVADADLVVLVAPGEGAAYSGLLPAFLDALPDGALAGKVVVPILAGADPVTLARFEGTLRRRLELAGASVALGELFDAADEFTGTSADRVLEARVDRAVSEARLAVGRAESPEPIQLAARMAPSLIAC